MKKIWILYNVDSVEKNLTKGDYELKTVRAYEDETRAREDFELVKISSDSKTNWDIMSVDIIGGSKPTVLIRDGLAK